MPNLKQTLLVDAASAALFVVICLGFTGQLAALTGLSASVIAVAGWICIPCTLLFVHQAFAPSRALVAVIVGGNIAWVLASVAVWLAHWSVLTPLGHAVVIAQALAVEGLAVLEWRGLKTLERRAVAR